MRSTNRRLNAQLGPLPKRAVRAALPLTALLALGALGCQPPTPKEVAERTGKQTAELLQGASEAAVDVSALGSLRTVTEPLAPYGVRLHSVDGTGAPSEADKARSKDAVDRLVKFLTERVFTDENLESRSGGSATFRLQGDDLCSDGTYQPPVGCRPLVDALEVRVVAASQPDDGLDLTLLIGPQRFDPFLVQLRKKSLAVRTKLDQVRASLAFAQTIQNLPARLPAVLEGTVEVRLDQLAPRDFRLALSVVKDVVVEWEGPRGAHSLRLGASAHPLWMVRANAAAGRLELAMDAGPSSYRLPYADVNPKTKAGMWLELDLSGLSFLALAEQGRDELALTSVGLGDGVSTVKLDGQTLFSVQLNETSGHRANLFVRPDLDGQPLVEVTPELDLALGFFFAPLEVDGPQPEYLRSESYRFSLTGGDKQLVKLLKAEPLTGFRGGLQVRQGTLRLATSRAGVAPVVVSAGQCLSGKSVEPGAHGLLGALAAVPCP